jgi:hypothetical protein
MIRESYKNYYGFLNRQEEKKIKALFMEILTLTIIGVCFIFSNDILSKILPRTDWADVFLEGLLVGGWVFMWEALHLITFERQDYFKRNKELKRFLKAPIVFGYKNTGTFN